MGIYKVLQKNNLEQLIFFQEESVNLRALIAIQNTVLGPAIGGIRMRNYPDYESLLQDSVHLSREMTLRALLADTDLGGGSAILWGDPAELKCETYFRAFGRFLERLKGQFFGVMEVGMNHIDLRNIKRETDYVLALPEAFGGIADPIDITADGILQGIKATAKFVFGQSSLEQVTCLVQGIGRLGGGMVERLIREKAKVIVTDLNYDKIKNIQDLHPEIEMIRPDEVLDCKCDMIIPCAHGFLVTPKTATRLKCQAIAGGGSNIFPDLETGDCVHKAGIVYTPHFLIDSGELIQADFELRNSSLVLLHAAVGEIYGRTLELLEASSEIGQSPIRMAIKRATERLTLIGNLGRRVLI